MGGDTMIQGKEAEQYEKVREAEKEAMRGALEYCAKFHVAPGRPCHDSGELTIAALSPQAKAEGKP